MAKIEGEKRECLVLDPGLRVSGVSLWRGGSLIDAGLVRVKRRPPPHHRGALSWVDMALGVTAWARERVKASRLVFVYEEMQFIAKWSASKRGKNPVEDLFQLNGVTGACAALLRPFEIYRYSPLVWKPRGEKKEVTHQRLKLRLSKEELVLLASLLKKTPKGLAHNMQDAIAIGAFHHRRKVS